MGRRLWVVGVIVCVLLQVVVGEVLLTRVFFRHGARSHLE